MDRLTELVNQRIILEVKPLEENAVYEVGKTYFKGFYQKCITVTKILEGAFPSIETIDEEGKKEIRSMCLSPERDYEVVLAAQQIAV